MKGENIITVRLANPWWEPYFMSGKNGFGLDDANGTRLVDLAGDWKYSNTQEQQVPKIYSFQTIPHVLYNGMIAPLQRMSIAGVIWYQGENNADQGADYQKLFPRMIKDWRSKFRAPELPFLFVQLANLGKPTLDAEEKGWPYLREAQDMALSLPNTGMASAIDLGDEVDIHPRLKATVGERLALNALKLNYGKINRIFWPQIPKS